MKSHNTNKHIKLLSWEEKIALLQAHTDKYKSCDLNRAPKEEVPPMLFNFVSELRKQYKRLLRKQHSTMTKERIDVLEKLGFDFTPLESGSCERNRDTKRQQQWDAQFANLEKYKAKHGDCLVSCLVEHTVSSGNGLGGCFIEFICYSLVLSLIINSTDLQTAWQLGSWTTQTLQQGWP